MGKRKKVLKAPHKITAPVGSSQGTVEFVDGVATEFTQAQADHYLNNFKGYELVDPKPVEDEPIEDESGDDKPDEEKTDLAKLVAGVGVPGEGDKVVDKASADKVDETFDDKPEDDDDDDDEPESELKEEEKSAGESGKNESKSEEKGKIDKKEKPFPEIVPSEKDHVNEIRTFITEYSVVKDGARRKADMLKAIRRDSRFKE